MDTHTLAEELGKLSNMEIAALTRRLEKDWGVQAVPQAPQQNGPQPPAPPPPDEQTEFTLVLKSVGAKKIDVIKLAREIVPGLGLKEAKELVEKVEIAPQVLRDGISKAEAEGYQKKLADMGATVDVR